MDQRIQKVEVELVTNSSTFGTTTPEPSEAEIRRLPTAKRQFEHLLSNLCIFLPGHLIVDEIAGPEQWGKHDKWE